MARFIAYCITLLLLALVHKASASNHIDSIRNELVDESNIAERIRLQYVLINHRDTQVQSEILETQDMDLNAAEKFECAYQLAYYHYRIKKNSELVAYWVGRMEESEQNNRLQRILVQLMKAESIYLIDHSKKNRYLLYADHSSYFLETTAHDDEIKHHIIYLYTMARYARWSNQLDSAFMFIEKARSYLKDNDSEVLKYHVNRELSYIYHTLEENAKAIEILQTTQESIYRQGVVYDQAYYHHTMGKYLGVLRESRDALEHLDKCEALCGKHNIPEFLGGALINQGVEYNKLGKLEDAERKYRQAIEFYSKTSYKSSVNRIVVLINMANVMRQRGKHTEASEMLHEVKEYGVAKQNPSLVHAALTNIATILYEQDLLDSALKVNKYVETMLTENESSRLLAILDTREKIYVGLNDFEKAHAVLQRINEVDKELFSADEHKQVINSRILLKQQVYKNELLASQMALQKMNDEQRIGLIVFVAILLIVAMIFLTYYLRSISKRQRVNLEIAELRERYSKTQLEALRSQINPHFIFNSLNTFQYFLRNKENSKALDYLETFSGLLRDTISASSEEFISLEKEIELLQQYLAIEMLRVSSSIDVRLDVKGLESPEKIGVPPMLIQPLLENAIWHGAGQTKNGQIEINFTVSEMLEVDIIDNGPGYSLGAKSSTKHKSYGIINVQKRLKNIGALHNVQASLRIINLSESGSQGTKQSIQLPLIKFYE